MQLKEEVDGNRKWLDYQQMEFDYQSVKIIFHIIIKTALVVLPELGLFSVKPTQTFLIELRRHQIH